MCEGGVVETKEIVICPVFIRTPQAEASERNSWPHFFPLIHTTDNGVLCGGRASCPAGMRDGLACGMRTIEFCIEIIAAFIWESLSGDIKEQHACGCVVIMPMWTRNNIKRNIVPSDQTYDRNSPETSKFNVSLQWGIKLKSRKGQDSHKIEIIAE